MSNRKVKALERRWQKLCEDAVELAREQGATDPQLYFEAESGFYAIDGDSHSGRDLDERANVVFNLGWPLGVKAGCGAW